MPSQEWGPSTNTARDGVGNGRVWEPAITAADRASGSRRRATHRPRRGGVDQRGLVPVRRYSRTAWTTTGAPDRSFGQEFFGLAPISAPPGGSHPCCRRRSPRGERWRKVYRRAFWRADVRAQRTDQDSRTSAAGSLAASACPAGDAHPASATERRGHGCATRAAMTYPERAADALRASSRGTDWQPGPASRPAFMVTPSGPWRL